MSNNIPCHILWHTSEWESLLLGEARVEIKSTVSGALSEHGIQYVLTHPSLAGWLSRCEVSNYL